jgi:hypothetical protein
LYGMGKVPDSMWGSFWHFWLLLQLGLSIPVCIWFTIGGTMDMRALLKSLAAAARDARDDGTVPVGAESAIPIPEEAEKPVATDAGH